MSTEFHTARSLCPLSVGSILVTAAAHYGAEEAFFCSGTGRRFTFRETNDRCNRLAHALAALNHKKGSVVAFLCSNRAEIVEIYFALAKTGIVGVPLNYRLAAPEMAALVRAMGATTLICEARFHAAVQWLHAHVPEIKQYLWIGAAGAPEEPEYETLLAKAQSAEPVAEMGEADPFYFNLTSGTTGLPKAYVLNQYNCAAAIPAMTFDMTRADRVLTVLPAFGRIGCAWLLLSILYGVRNVLANFEPREVLQLIETEGVSIVNLVPTMAAMLLDVADLRARQLGSLRAIVFAGAMLPPHIREQTLARLCPAIYEYYGMQEAGLLTISGPENKRRKPDSVGLPALYAQIRVVDRERRDVGVGEIGEILGRSPSSATSYFQSPQRTAETFRDGWIHTGDLGRLDAEGYLYICGRTKDMIISGGQNVHSAEVEAALLEFPEVSDCAVIGLPHATWGEQVAAVIVTGESSAIQLESVQAFCRQSLAGFKIPRLLFIRREPLPRTPTGKVQKFLLVEQYGGKSE